MTEINETEKQNPKTDHNTQLLLAGKYITFKLADEEYAFEILKVREIIGMMDITRVPQVDSAIKGVINLRGKVNPVVDSRLVFGMSETISTDQTVIVMVQLHTNDQVCTMGVLVDEVLEVLSVDNEDIEPPPNMGDFNTMNQAYILGVAKVNKRVIFLLDINKVLNSRQKESINSIELN
jgi:purine-binding chemotaxis protein CheW